MITLLVFVGTILVLVGVHEGGHFLAAKLAGVYVEEFAIGFGPKLLSFRKGETRYSVRAIPFGGYVRMAGEDREVTSSEIKADRLLYNKPPFTRILISLSGPTANLFTTLLIAVLALWAFGTPIIQVEDVIPGMPASAVLKSEDRVLSIQGHAIYNSETLSRLIQQSGGEPIDILVERNGESKEFTVRPQFDPIEERYVIGAYFWPVIRTNKLALLDPSSPFSLAGLKENDRIVAVDGEATHTAVAIVGRVDELLPTDSITFTVLREGGQLEIFLSTTGFDLNQSLAGIAFANLGITYRRPGFAAGFVLGAGQFSDYVHMIVEWVHAILTGQVTVSETIAGPVGIARLLGEGIKQGPNIFLWLFSYLSLSLGVLNLIPFPALDGSRAAFGLYELVFRRRISPRTEGMIHAIGGLIIIALMLLVTYKDIVKLFQ